MLDPNVVDRSYCEDPHERLSTQLQLMAMRAIDQRIDLPTEELTSHLQLPMDKCAEIAESR